MTNRLTPQNFNIKFSITNKMLGLCCDISYALASLSNLNIIKNYPRLKKTNRAKSISSSLSIENNTLSYQQVVDVINGKRVLGYQQDILAVQNANRAYAMLEEIQYDSIADLLLTHSVMMSKIATNTGRFRTDEVFVSNKAPQGYKVIYKPPYAKDVPNLINQLFFWLKNDETPFLIKSCVFHYYLVAIHPFNDGNGRISRLWQTAILAVVNPIFKWTPVETAIYSKRDQYYDILNECDKTFDCTTFIEFMLQAIFDSIKDVTSQTKLSNSTLPAHIINMLSIMKDDQWSSTQLMTKLKLNSKSGFIKNYLQPALYAGVIAMTDPANPTSKNQKYYKK